MDQHSASRSKRQPIDVMILHVVSRNAVGASGRCVHVAKGHAADLAGRGNVSFQKRRRDTEYAGDVIETIVRVIRRQEARPTSSPGGCWESVSSLCATSN